MGKVTLTRFLRASTAQCLLLRAMVAILKLGSSQLDALPARSSLINVGWFPKTLSCAVSEKMGVGEDYSRCRQVELGQKQSVYCGQGVRLTRSKLASRYHTIPSLVFGFIERRIRCSQRRINAGVSLRRRNLRGSMLWAHQCYEARQHAGGSRDRLLLMLRSQQTIQPVQPLPVPRGSSDLTRPHHHPD